MKIKGSVTVFFSLIFMLIGSLFFSMLEVIRIRQMQVEAQVIAEETVSSLFSEYEKELLNKYDLLALDAGYGKGDFSVSKMEQRMEEFMWKNLENEKPLNGSAAITFFRLQPKECEVMEYGVFTDQSGLPFVKQGAQIARQKVATSFLKTWEKEGAMLINLAGTDYDLDKSVEQGEKALKDDKNKQELQVENENEQVSVDNEDGSKDLPVITKENNPFRVFKRVKEAGILGLVVDENQISQSVYQKTNKLSNRKCIKGNSKEKVKVSQLDWLFYEWYVLHYFDNYTKQKEDSGLSYEMEYVLAGKNSDKENLEAVVKRILAMRVVENSITILSSPNMLKETNDVALAIAGVSANPAVIEAVQLATIVVWSMVESILDLRTLLKSKKVSAIKTEQDWVSKLSTLGTCLSTNMEAKEDSQGLSYEQYLFAIFQALNKKEKAIRPMEVIENQLYKEEKTNWLQMDQLVYRVSGRCEMSGEPIFYSLLGNVSLKMNFYQYQGKAALTYE